MRYEMNNSPALIIAFPNAFFAALGPPSLVPSNRTAVEAYKAVSLTEPPLRFFRVVFIIGSEAAAHGCCTLHIEAIAARAGVRRTTVQNAVREASKLGLLDVRERRRKGQKSLTNVIRVISKEWLLWLKRGGGFKKSNTTVTSIKNTSPKTPGMVPGYRMKRLGRGEVRSMAERKGSAKVAATSK